MEILFWCEFPEKADWAFIQRLFSQEDFRTDIFVACRSAKELEKLRKGIKKTCPNIKQVNPWPILSESEGYWFSGFTEKESIDKLHRYSSLNIKVDLEPPYPKVGYGPARLVLYGISCFVRKTKNSSYLENSVVKLGRNSKIISNEFPLPEFITRSWGCFIDVRKYENMEKNFIFYSTFIKRLRFMLRAYYKWFSKKAVKKYRDKVMFSLGLLGPGIFSTEPAYRKISELKKDIEIVKKAGANKIAIYSIERLQERERPEEWIQLLKSYL
jgi:hypothetical protein